MKNPFKAKIEISWKKNGKPFEHGYRHPAKGYVQQYAIDCGPTEYLKKHKTWKGAPVYAMEDCVVTVCNPSYRGGYVVVTNYETGLEVSHVHVRPSVRKGQKIIEGDKIGTIAAKNPYTTGPHDHIFARRGGKRIHILEIFVKNGWLKSAVNPNVSLRKVKIDSKVSTLGALYIRTTPGLKGSKIALIAQRENPKGKLFFHVGSAKVVQGPVEKDGYTWWKLKVEGQDYEIVGWAVEAAGDYRMVVV